MCADENMRKKRMEKLWVRRRKRTKKKRKKKG